MSQADNVMARSNVHHGTAHYNFSGSKQCQPDSYLYCPTDRQGRTQDSTDCGLFLSLDFGRMIS